MTRMKVGVLIVKIAIVIMTVFCSLLVSAYDFQSSEKMRADEKPRQLEGVGVEENLGEFIDLDLSFRSDSGKITPLAEVLEGQVPILMTMVYYNCPSLCSYHLNGLNDVFRDMKWNAGQDFKFVAVSMDHREGSELAAKKKNNYLKDFGRSGGEAGWHFLTGTEENVRALADQLGFGFRWDEKRQEYAHPAVAYILTPEGQISKYLHGINFNAQTLRLALVEASQGKVGTLIDQIFLFCYRFDPSKNKYTLAAYNIMRLGGLLTLLVLAIILVPLWLRGDRLGSVSREG